MRPQLPLLRRVNAKLVQHNLFNAIFMLLHTCKKKKKSRFKFIYIRVTSNTQASVFKYLSIQFIFFLV